MLLPSLFLRFITIRPALNLKKMELGGYWVDLMQPYGYSNDSIAMSVILVLHKLDAHEVIFNKI